MRNKITAKLRPFFYDRWRTYIPNQAHAEPYSSLGPHLSTTITFLLRVFFGFFPGSIRHSSGFTSNFSQSQHPIDCEKAFHIRSEEHTSELQSLMRISYAVFCLNKKKQHKK